jgi:hypothetical protein
MATSPHISNLIGLASGIGLIRAEMALWLPRRAVVRREILKFAADDRQLELKPDRSSAGISVLVSAHRFHAMLSGPERADLEVEWLVEPNTMVRLPLWSMSHGRDAEVSIWDAFGQLVVPDVMARGPDTAPLMMASGRYTLTASVFGSTALMVTAGHEHTVMTAEQFRSVAG